MKLAVEDEKMNRVSNEGPEAPAEQTKPESLN